MTAKEQKQLIIVGILIIILVIAVYSSFSSLPKNRNAPPAIAAAVAVVSPVPVDRGDQAKLALQKERGSGAWGRDPFAGSAVKTEEQVTAFKLQGITIGRGTGYAFINDMIVREGDTIGGYRIAGVSKDKVVLQRGEQKLYLSFPEFKTTGEK